MLAIYVTLLAIVVILSTIAITLKCRKNKEHFLDNSAAENQDQYLLNKAATEIESPGGTIGVLHIGEKMDKGGSLISDKETIINSMAVQGNINISSEKITFKNDKSLESSFLKSVVDLIYPVGSIYLSMSTKYDPNKIFTGTTWERIEDKYMYNYDESNKNKIALGSTGGSLTITPEVLASHSHKLDNWESNESGAHAHYTNFKFDKNKDYSNVMEFDTRNPLNNSGTLYQNNKAYEAKKEYNGYNNSSDFTNTVKIRKTTGYTPYSTLNYSSIDTISGEGKNKIETSKYGSNEYNYKKYFPDEVAEDTYINNQESSTSKTAHSHNITGAFSTYTETTGEGKEWYPPSICIVGWKRTK